MLAQTYNFNLPDEASTLSFAAQLAQALSPGMVIYLQGDLGAGKTTLTRGLLNSLGYQGKVKSPTYTLMESYQIKELAFRHFDLYRLQDPEEWEAAGFRDEFNDKNILLIEWPEKANGILPPADITVTILVLNTGRELTLSSHSTKGQQCLNYFAN